MVRAFDVRLELSSVTPRVWRLLRVPADLRLDDLHHAIQSVMGWGDFHPHVFEVGEGEYGPRPEPDDDDEEPELVEPERWAGEDDEISIAAAFEQSPGGVTYVYDFDADWRVQITLVEETTLDAREVVTCLAGEHAGPQQESRALDPFSVDRANRRLKDALRPRATSEFPAGPGAGPDQQLLANLTLVVLLLGSRPTRHGTREAWKNVRFEILDSLAEAGLIDSDPRRKSVTITGAGVAHAERLLQRLRAL
jgi:hypothetical protein